MEKLKLSEVLERESLSYHCGGCDTVIAVEESGYYLCDCGLTNEVSGLSHVSGTCHAARLKRSVRQKPTQRLETKQDPPKSRH